VTGAVTPPPVLRLDTVDSTQTAAFELARTGARDRTVVVAEHQSAGRGRRGRRWEDERGTALLASIVVRPRHPVAEWPRLGFAAALAVAEALGSAAGLEARLRWPNDVLVGGRKIAGILLEARDQVVVIGIGVNLAQAGFSADLADRATSIRLAGGRPVDRDTLLAVLLARFDAWRAVVEGGDFEPVRQAWLARADTLGRTVHAGEHAGVAVGLDDDGALLVRDGPLLHRVVAGDVGA
jgi:BirA family biotin operon repressor/biotin-[acetyl-CoA-carboxylase] ligase